MKILKLRFRNLNSLAGEWMIDFTVPAFTMDGLFAIVGPTGAGKTTLLDAISLALFQRTPRLKTFTVYENEIMSRQTSDCMAEVTFRINGKTYRSFFEQKRSRKGSKNPFSVVKCELTEVTGSDAGDTLLAASIREMEKKRNEILGLDFDQFSRSVLLAQGEFKDFLFEQKAGERAKLLEKITGTGIYTEIGKKVFEMFSQKNRALEDWRLSLNTRQKGLLPEEEVAECEKEWEDWTAKREPLDKELAELETQIARLRAFDSLKAEQTELEAERVRWVQETADFAKEKEQLERHSLAVPLVPLFRETGDTRRTLLVKTEEQQATVERLAKLNRELAVLLPRIDASEESLRKAERALAEQTPILAEVRRLDQDEKNLHIAVGEAAENLEKRQKRLKEIRMRRAELQKDKETSERQKREREAIVEERKQRLSDRTTAGILEEKNRVQETRRRWKDLREYAVQLAKNRQNQGVQEGIRVRSEEENVRLEAERKTVQVRLDVLREGIASQNQVVQRSEDVEHLKTYRVRLVEGEPCPLCGALHHPLELPEWEAAAEKAKRAALQREEREQNDLLISLAVKSGQAETERRTAIRRWEEYKAEEALLQTHLEKQVQELELEELPEDVEIQATLARLESEEKTLAEDAKAAADYDAKIQKATVALEKMEENLSTWDALEATFQETEREEKDAMVEVQKRRTSWETCREKRRERFQDADPDIVEQAFQKVVKNAQKTVAEQKTQKERNEATLTALVESQKKMELEIETLRKTMETLETEWTESLVVAGFVDENDFQSAQLTAEEQTRKQKRQKELETWEASVTAKIQSVEERLTQIQSEPLPQATLNELLERLQSRKETEKDISTRIGALTEKLRQNKLRMEEVAEELEKWKVFRKKTERWDKLNRLIGGRDNPRFRRIVQRFSLEILLANANLQLERLAPRYVLVLPSEDPDKELSIACQDTCFNNEIRPVSNLSGGETFLVSLALALGLSKMSSRNVPMDSLFLDEGFGTLDEETLQTALESLSMFQSGGGEQKLIGIISHVEALQERIANKIEVVPQSLGRSRLRGNGVCG